MKKQRNNKNGLFKSRNRLISLLALVAFCVVSMGAVYDVASKEITITNIDEFQNIVDTKTVKTRQNSVGELLDENQISVGQYDKLNLPATAELEEHNTVVLRRGKPVVVVMDEEEQTVVTTKANLGDALLETGYVLGEDDEVVPALDSAVEENMRIEVTRVDYRNDTITQPVERTVREKEDTSLPKGQTKVLEEGQDGEREIVERVMLKDGAEVSRETVSDTVTVEAQEKVIAVGTAVATPKPTAKPKATKAPEKQKKTEASASGAGTINGRSYKKKITVTATAYSTSPSENGGYTVTAMGTPLRRGVIAVDPTVIPLGSKVYIESANGSWTYGEAVAQDTGGAIKGNRIDLCYTSVSEAKKFGRQSAVVYVLE